jgi:hypothetical protein
LNTSGASTSSTANTLERKISVEEKRSVTNSKSSISNNQQLNDSGTTLTSLNEHSKISSTLKEEGEILNDDESGACIVM